MSYRSSEKKYCFLSPLSYESMNRGHLPRQARDEHELHEPCTLQILPSRVLSCSGVPADLGSLATVLDGQQWDWAGRASYGLTNHSPPADTSRSIRLLLADTLDLARTSC